MGGAHLVFSEVGLPVDLNTSTKSLQNLAYTQKRDITLFTLMPRNTFEKFETANAKQQHHPYLTHGANFNTAGAMILQHLQAEFHLLKLM